jgi:hypothetical protein
MRVRNKSETFRSVAAHLAFSPYSFPTFVHTGQVGCFSRRTSQLNRQARAEMWGGFSISDPRRSGLEQRDRPHSGGLIAADLSSLLCRAERAAGNPELSVLPRLARG